MHQTEDDKQRPNCCNGFRSLVSHIVNISAMTRDVPIPVLDICTCLYLLSSEWS